MINSYRFRMWFWFMVTFYKIDISFIIGDFYILFLLSLTITNGSNNTR